MADQSTQDAQTAGGIRRSQYQGRTYRWQRQHPDWPGKTSEVVIGVDQLILADRYRHDSFGSQFSCHLRDFLDGCFHESIAGTFGTSARDEMLAEVRHVLGIPEPGSEAAKQKEAEERAEAARKAAAEAAARKPTPEPAGKPAEPEKRPDKVDITLTACKRVDLVLATNLRQITRKPIKDLLANLAQLPQVLMSAVPYADGEAIRDRLAALGATVELRG